MNKELLVAAGREQLVHPHFLQCVPVTIGRQNYWAVD